MGDTPTGGNFGDGDLFKEIGHTLETVSHDVASGTVSALRTAVARQILDSPEGQAQIAETRNREVGRFLPYIIIGVVLLILFGRKLGG